MRPSTSDQIRAAFLEFFEEYGHQRLPSSSLIPYNDNTLLLTNAGMVQFKDVFLGLETRPYSRAVTAQKCMRVSGKHNDLENVGPSSRHHTFFEMLGNFSFGDYFKADAIRYAYDFLTKAVGFPPERLYYTVFQDDDEALGYWTQLIGIDPGRVYRMGEKTNFWSMGDVGPCGPTSEIHYDWGPQACTCGQPDCSVLLDNGCERWLEVWNLVFMQFNQDERGVRTLLPKPGVDTGMGLERIVSIVQQQPVNYDTDLFAPIMDRIQALLGHTAAERAQHIVGYRVIADHARAAAFLVADGVRPASTDAGYVLRMVIRRAFRFGRKIGFDKPFLAQVCEAVVAKMGGAYPELRERQRLIASTVTLEEEQFMATLDRALVELDRALANLAVGQTVLPGAVAFDLKSTHGLPLEVTRDICGERGYTIDEVDFRQAEETHRRLSQGKLSEAVFAAGAERYAAVLRRLQQAGLLPEAGTMADPYGPLTVDTQLVAILGDGELVEAAEAGQEVELILAETPFYVAAGGQVSDTGVITAERWQARVDDVHRPLSGLTVHRATITSGVARVGDAATISVDSDRRWSIMRNHTATHLLHAALRERLGEHVHQAGSLVAPDRLRFDFTHEAALTPAEMDAISRSVNAAILADYPVQAAAKAREQALAEGAMALFGEKYGDVVRAISLGDRQTFWSNELCGGTHVHSTGQIGPFLVVNESSAAAGVRRIEAITGHVAEDYTQEKLQTLDRMARALGVPSEAVEQKVQELKNQVGELMREVSRLRQQGLTRQAERMTDRVQQAAGVNVLATRVDAVDAASMRLMADDLRNKLGSGIVVLGAVDDDRVTIIIALTPDIVQRGGHAGAIAKSLGLLIGGSGGGRPDVAQAGGKHADKLDAALAAVPDEVARQLSS